MPGQIIMPTPYYDGTVRGDRMYEKPSAKNAQGMFPPAACLFVGNLSTKVPVDQLAADLETKFSGIGPCHVKIKQDRVKGLPGAFMQFERVEHALLALAWNECTQLHDRWLRIEKAKGRRTVWVGLRNGAPITEAHIAYVLYGRGCLEGFCYETVHLDPYTLTIVFKGTFRYVDDAKDLVKYYQRDHEFYCVLLDVDGSPYMDPLYNNSPSLPSISEEGDILPSPRSQAAIDATRDMGPSRERLDPEFQPTTGRTIEDYVRCMARTLKIGLGETALVDVIRQLENEWKDRTIRRHWGENNLVFPKAKAKVEVEVEEVPKNDGGGDDNDKENATPVVEHHSDATDDCEFCILTPNNGSDGQSNTTTDEGDSGDYTGLVSLLAGC